MISRIQNVSFAGAKQRVANRVAKEFEEVYVSASSNLKGTVNEKEAARQLRDAEIAVDKDNLIGRIASLLTTRKNISASEVKAVKEAPMPTPAEIAEVQGISMKQAEGPLDYFG